MTPEQLQALLNVPSYAALIFIIVRQQRFIDDQQRVTAELIKEFMAMHPPQAEQKTALPLSGER